MSEEEKKFSITIKSINRDLRSFMKLVPERKKKIEEASNEPITTDNMNTLARRLHPERQYMIIDSIKDETKTTKTFKLVPDPESDTKELAYFRAGQYLSLKVKINDVRITRAYSISSSPKDSSNGFYEITIRKEEHGFLTNFIWENWKVGTKVVSSGPEGFFYYEYLRDAKNIVGIGGGSGITPFRSLAKDIVDGNIDAKLLILYGSSDEEDIIFYDEFKALEMTNPDKIKTVFILSCDEVTLDDCEKGFITADIIKKYADVNNSSFFICGPQVMYNFVDKELKTLNLPQRRIRKEAFGEIKNIVNFPGYPKELAEKTFKLTVHMDGITKELPAIATESILVAIERGHLSPPSKCRSGECGFCRALLISGDVYISPVGDGRREADKKFGFFHPCYSYPISDIEVNIPKDE